MSANLDLVRSIYADWERGDYGHTDWAGSEIDYVVLSDLEPHTSTGLSGVAEHMGKILTDLDAVRHEAEEYREIDCERVLVLLQSRARGKKSGVPVSHACAEVFEVQDCKVTRITFYFDRDRAFTDLGLTPEDSHDVR